MSRLNGFVNEELVLMFSDEMCISQVLNIVGSWNSVCILWKNTTSYVFSQKTFLVAIAVWYVIAGSYIFSSKIQSLCDFGVWLNLKGKVTFCWTGFWSGWGHVKVNFLQPTVCEISWFKCIWTMTLTLILKVKVTVCFSWLIWLRVYVSKLTSYNQKFVRYHDLCAFALWLWPMTLKIKVTFWYPVDYVRLHVKSTLYDQQLWPIIFVEHLYYDLGPLTLKFKITFCSPWLFMWMHLSKARRECSLAEMNKNH